MPAKVLSVTEIILKITLTGAFILALARSILSLSRGLTTRRNFVGENSHFPAVTFCPFTYVSSRDGAVNTQNVDATFKVHDCCFPKKNYVILYRFFRML